MSEFGLDTWQEKVRPSIERITRSMFEAVKDDEILNSRRNTFEIYGLDIMLDDNFNAWLLEINRYPAISGADRKLGGSVYPPFNTLHHGYAEITTIMIRDILKVVIDWENDKSADTGQFRLIN